MLNRVIKLSAIALATAALVGCGGNPDRPSNGGSSSSATPSKAEQACLRDVTRQTNNPDVVLMGSEPYQGGGRYVRVGVGPDQAPWQCIGYDDGTTMEIMSLTNEGGL